MSLLTAHKQQIVKDYQLAEGDTGSPEVQAAILTNRINYLTTHMQTHKKDFHSRQGLLRMVNKRRNILDYLKKRDRDRYTKLIERLKLRY